MTDPVLTAFLQQQYREGMALADASDLLDLVPCGGEPPHRYVARFRCTGLVKSEAGEIVEANEFAIGISFHDSYLSFADPMRVVTLLDPPTTFGPHVRAPFICIGRLRRGTPLVSILYQCFAVLTYGKLRLDDPLDPAAAAWARHNLHRFPLDRRPLKRRAAGSPVAELDPTRAPDGGADFDLEVVEVTS